jgi:uncharacterized protein (TIGR03435 family)
MTLHNIVWIALNLPSERQLIGPEWMREPRYDITAKIAANATREQFFQMFQNMLAERFGLAFHRDQREVPGYELVVGKGGPKFRESAPEAPMEGPPPRLTPTGPTSLGPDGFPVLPPGYSGSTIARNRAVAQWMRMPMERFARTLMVEKPVVDATGLEGKYDLSLKWVPDLTRPDADGPSIFAALQEQLGLKLIEKKNTLPFVVIDRIQKVPTEN